MRKALPSTALLAFAAACSGGDGGGGGGTGGNVATTVTIAPANLNLNAIGATQVVKATVRNQNGGVMNGAALAWSSNAAAATVTSLGGDSAVVTAVANGAAQVTATSGAASGQAAVQIAQAAFGLQKVAGDAQTGAVGAALATQLGVRVVDRLSAPIVGATVTFAVTAGGGTITPSATSGANGVALATWTLGTNAAQAQAASASAAGVAAAAQFTANPVSGPPATIAIQSGNNQTGGTGSPVASPPSVKVTDAFGNPVVGVMVTFAVTGGGGSVTGAQQTTDVNGVATVGSWTLGSGAGPNTLGVTVAGSAAATAFSATAVTTVPGTIAVNLTSSNQVAMAGTPVPDRPSVVVRDASNNPISGVTVTFSVTAGGGSLTGATQTTNASGVATVGSWTLGATASPNQVRATVSTPGITGGPIHFNASGCQGGGGGGYAITLCFTSTMTPTQRAVFETAAAKWASVITSDLADLAVDIGGGQCGAGSPAVDLSIDDLLIFATVEDIDGPGAVLGSAGWCFRRTGGLPIMGLMRFDAADVASLESNSLLDEVIIHEMGHVVGVGSMWSTLGLLQNPTPGGGPGLDTFFSGANAITGFDAIGGNTYTGGNKVPVENTGGVGTANVHWRESVLLNELMTGFIDDGSNPLSILTVRSLQDMGYSVNTAAAEAFSLTLTLRADRGGTKRGVWLHNDQYTGPRYEIDRRGRRTLIK